MFEYFIYDNIPSKLQDICVVHFQEENLAQSGGSSSEILTYKNNRTNKWIISSIDYNEPLKFEIQIINTDCSVIDSVKERYLNRWLLTNQYRWLQIEKDDYSDIQFKCIFSNPQRLVVGGKTYGMQYNITCDASWGYSSVFTKTTEDIVNNQLYIYNDSDELNNYIYPVITIKALKNCNLKIENIDDNLNNRYFLLKNISKNEIIYIDNENQIITTNNSSHNYILGDFNKQWIRLGSGNNHLVFSDDCEIKIEYRTIRKVGAL